MNETDFLSKMKDILELESEPAMATPFGDTDSLTKISTAVFLNASFGIVTTLKNLQQMQTLGDLYAFCLESPNSKEKETC